ncbi:hypothetical protein FJV46_13475 [Arthrobacter agilis]|uniref:hypothetical protein n=1 Tax=Arthrobacter agilis TaxID=37921 RepID=UPI000B35D7DE|nr:hypothetical protein [Arthrobacter agilis]OUM44741.1 hypothetical protein B8W74_02285 [Arthrobacter agilis]PPB47066.1 hypothetical protein CI784_03315 [Arthrobacter agilis]TPV22480.1 hypothetical protein FJV46_13475 [Arthrobacter agilis]VDR32292.1 Uncharacterised protein [Arthrobacter agilis]
MALVLLIGVLSAALWYGWFAWDTEYQYDRATGRMGGPYAIWQGVGAFVCSIFVFWLAQRLLRFIVAFLVMPSCFTLAWITTAASADVTGLWLVGAILVAVGSAMGSAVMLGLITAVDADLRKDIGSAPTPT